MISWSSLPLDLVRKRSNSHSLLSVHDLNSTLSPKGGWRCSCLSGTGKKAHTSISEGEGAKVPLGTASLGCLFKALIWVKYPLGCYNSRFLSLGSCYHSWKIKRGKNNCINASKLVFSLILETVELHTLQTCMSIALLCHLIFYFA